MSRRRLASFELSAEEFTSLRSLALARGDLLEQDGSALLAFGTAEEIALRNGLADDDAVAAVGGRLQELGGPGALPIALGALPFRPDAPAHLRLPEVAALRRDSGTVAVVTGPDPAALLESLLGEARSRGRGHGPVPAQFSLCSARSHDDFLTRVAKAIAEVRSGRLEKVVLAREVRIEANRDFCQEDLLERLRALHPSCLTFAVEGFIGASPELLVARQQEAVRSHPLAGTAARSGDPESDARAAAQLLASEKERSEHRAVVEAIAGALSPLTRELSVPPGPAIVSLRNVSHLGTEITGSLAPRPGGGLPSALEALALVHPTPAVCGTPRETALEYIEKEEEVERGRYGGPVGWVRSDGDGEFHLGIRAGTVEGPTARLFAGVGIVADSDPAAELGETQLKLQAMLAALVRP